MKNTVERGCGCYSRGAAAKVHLIGNQVRSSSEHAEHNCGKLIGKEFGRRYQENPDT
jgi:hypothetical protein